MLSKCGKKSKLEISGFGKESKSLKSYTSLLISYIDKKLEAESSDSKRTYSHAFFLKLELYLGYIGILHIPLPLGWGLMENLCVGKKEERKKKKKRNCFDVKYTLEL